MRFAHVTFYIGRACICGAAFGVYVNAAAAVPIVKHWADTHRGEGHRACNAERAAAARKEQAPAY